MSRSGIKTQFLGVVGFKRATLTAYCVKVLNGSPKTENIFKFECSLWTKSSTMISGTQIYFTPFLASSHKS